MAAKPDVLIINSYAGSLTIAAHQSKHRIIGSYEDSGYGLPVQKENFPKLEYRDTTADWPEKNNLKDAIVLAHPPCSAFSQLTPRYLNQVSLHGVDSDAFACTKLVLDYAMKHKAMAIAVESVVPALAGAEGVHREYADKYGYTFHRILQNAATFGVPQWRSRFWVIFVRKGVLPKGTMHIHHAPEPVMNVESVLLKRGEVDEYDVHRMARQVELVKQRWGAPFLKQLMSGKAGIGNMPELLERKLKEDGELKTVKTKKTVNGKQYEPGSRGAIAKEFCLGPFFSNTLRVLDPKLLAPVVLGNSWWMTEGRNLFREEYKALMGFPVNYKFPGKHVKKFREYLSKGVCPPVARWILEQVTANVTGKTHAKAVPVGSGEVLNIIPKRRLFQAGEEV